MLSGKNRKLSSLFIIGVAFSTVTLPQIGSGLASPQTMIDWLQTGLPHPFPCDRVAADAINDVLAPPFAATDLVNLAISFYTEKRTFGVIRWPKTEVPDNLREQYKRIGITIPSTVEEIDARLHQVGVKTFISVDDPDLTEQLIDRFHYTPVRELTICAMPSTVLYVPG
jgi:hypothetical protein